MTMPSLPMTGHCRCTQVEVRISAPPLLTGAYHCTGCQRMSSSAFSLSAAFPGDCFEVTKGEPVIGGLHGDEAQHFHCPHCMSWMFTRVRSVADAFVNLRPTRLENALWFVPFIESYMSEKLPWVTIPAKHSYTEFPSMDAYPALMQDFGKGLRQVQ
ncbi:GFA family protein [Roseovarius arcticus]|uniref:GFA family protein n=1 Tax=Roseovarius arcticus TaxID=2547404 RepID=UPI0011106F9B|nr:GFA family protein [Roseovarius arcticus]